MSAKFRTLRRRVALAWILLLALLPQLVVKSLHCHDSVPTCSGRRADAQAVAAVCVDCLREAAAQAARKGQRADDANAPSPQDAKGKSAQCRHHSDQQGEYPGQQHHNCGICHFQPSPYTIPTVVRFCFFVSTPETPFICDSPSVYHTVTERAVMRGPPLV